MLIAINFETEDVVFQNDRKIVFKQSNKNNCNLWVHSVEGETREDYNTNDTLRGGYLKATKQGGLRLRSYKG